MINKYGTTCPCLKIARAYDVDYAIPLMIVDNLLHDREPKGELVYAGLIAMQMPLWQEMRLDCEAVADETREAWERGGLT